MAIKHTKKRQFVFSFYQDSYRFHPAKIIELGIIKIGKYPQELESNDVRDGRYFRWLLITIKLFIPKIMFRWIVYFNLYFNNKPLFRKRISRKNKKIAAEFKRSEAQDLDTLVEKSLELKKD